MDPTGATQEDGNAAIRLADSVSFCVCHVAAVENALRATRCDDRSRHARRREALTRRLQLVGSYLRGLQQQQQKPNEAALREWQRVSLELVRSSLENMEDTLRELYWSRHYRAFNHEHTKERFTVAWNAVEDALRRLGKVFGSVHTLDAEDVCDGRVEGKDFALALLGHDEEALTLDELRKFRAEMDELRQRMETKGSLAEMNTRFFAFMDRRIPWLENQRVKSIVFQLGWSQKRTSQATQLVYSLKCDPVGMGGPKQIVVQRMDPRPLKFKPCLSDCAGKMMPSGAKGLGFGSNAGYVGLPALGPAELEHKEVQDALGFMFSLGARVPVDHKQSASWYRRSAEQGYAPAQHSLGLCLREGKGVTKDLREAFAWFSQAAAQGNRRAQYRLGICYRKGEGVAKDYREALKWFLKSAEQGHSGAQNLLGLIYDKGEGVSKDMEMAVAWYNKSAQGGDGTGQSNLGSCFLIGQGVPRDHAEAVDWFQKSAASGSAVGACNLGYCYIKGKGVAMNFEKAVFWFKRSAAHGCAMARWNLTCCKVWGALPRLMRKPLHLFITAAEPEPQRHSTNWHKV